MVPNRRHFESDLGDLGSAGADRLSTPHERDLLLAAMDAGELLVTETLVGDAILRVEEQRLFEVVHAAYQCVPGQHLQAELTMQVGQLLRRHTPRIVDPRPIRLRHLVVEARLLAGCHPPCCLR